MSSTSSSIPDYTYALHSNPNHTYTPGTNRILKTTIHKSTRHISHRALAPRLPDILWTEHDDNSLLSTPASDLPIPTKSKAACLRRLRYLRHEAAARESNYESFTLFPKLPTELQHMVWVLAAREPRVVELHSVALTIHLALLNPPEATEAARSMGTTPVSEFVLQRQHFRSRTFEPPLLLACHTSRTIALRCNGYTKTDLALDGEMGRQMHDAVHFQLRRDVAFFSAKSMHRWWVAANEMFNRGPWRSRAATAFPIEGGHYAAGNKIRRGLRFLAVEAGFFLGLMGKMDEGVEGWRREIEGDVKRKNVRMRSEFMVVVWERVWGNLKREFTAMERLLLVVGDDWDGDSEGEGPPELPDRCLAAMQLEEIKEGDREWRVLNRFRERLGVWTTWRQEETEPIGGDASGQGDKAPVSDWRKVEILLMRARTYGKGKGKGK